MIVVANRIRVSKGYEAAFEARFRDREFLLSRLPGFIRNEVSRPVKSDVYVVKTWWETMEDFERWTGSEEFHKAHAGPLPKEAYSGPNLLEIHEVFSLHEMPAVMAAQTEVAKEKQPRIDGEESKQVAELNKTVKSLRAQLDRGDRDLEALTAKLSEVDARLTRQERRGSRK